MTIGAARKDGFGQCKRPVSKQKCFTRVSAGLLLCIDQLQKDGSAHKIPDPEYRTYFRLLWHGTIPQCCSQFSWNLPNSRTNYGLYPNNKGQSED